MIIIRFEFDLKIVENIKIQFRERDQLSLLELGFWGVVLGKSKVIINYLIEIKYMG